MLRNTTVRTSTSIRHATTAGNLSAIEQQATISHQRITNSKINGMSIEALQVILKIQEDSFKNIEERDSLVHSTHLAKLKIQALDEKEKNNQNENFLEPSLCKAIKSIKQDEEIIREKIFSLSKEIQTIEKKQQQAELAARRREVEFEKHRIDCKALLDGRNNLVRKRDVLSEKLLELQSGRNAKTGEIDSLLSKMKKEDKSIEKVLEVESGKIYEEMMQAETLLKQNGMQLPSEKRIEELTECLCKLTEHPMSEHEQKAWRIDERLKVIIYWGFFGFIAGKAIPIAGKDFPFAIEMERLWKKTWGSFHEAARIKDPHDFSNNAEFLKIFSQELEEVAFAFICTALLRLALIHLRKSEIAKIKSASKPVQRTFKKGVINPAASLEEEALKFAFGLAKHANLKLVKSPLETMTKEVTRLVMNARINGETSIKIDDDGKRKINIYLTRLKRDLKRENDDLEKKLDAEINKIIAPNKSELRDLSEKADFVKQSLTNNEPKAVCDIADKAKFMNEFSKILNISSEDVLAAAIGNMIAGMSQDMIGKLSVADAASTDTETSSFEQRIKDAEKKKETLNQAHLQARKKLKEIDRDNKKIEENIREVEEEIRSKNSNISLSKIAMETISLSEEKLAAYASKLKGDSIDIKLKGEYAELTPEKIKHIKTQQRENEERLAVLLQAHDNLYDEYSRLQHRRKKNEDQLERIKFLKTNRSDKDEQIRNIQNDISAWEQEIGGLESEERKRLHRLDRIDALKEILTPKAISLVVERHLAQSDENLQKHARKYGYSSNYRSVGHFLKACLDIHASLQQEIETSGEPRLPNGYLQGYFAKSDIDVADGMAFLNRPISASAAKSDMDAEDGMDPNFRNMPISASVADIKVKTDQGKKKYLIDHIYGYVPRERSR